MPDFFTRLAEQVLGISEAVGPVTTPLFAPGPPLPMAQALGPQEEANEVEHQADVGTDPARTLLVVPLLRPDPGPRLLDRGVGPAILGEQTHDAPSSVQLAESGPVARSTDVALSGGPVPSHLPDIGGVVPNRPFAPVRSPDRDPFIRAVRPERIHADGSRPPVAVRPPRIGPTEVGEVADLDTARPSGTSIRVTIGRVEVKAVVAPQPPARPRVAPRPPALSLEDYLKQRSNGQR